MAGTESAGTSLGSLDCNQSPISVADDRGGPIDSEATKATTRRVGPGTCREVSALSRADHPTGLRCGSWVTSSRADAPGLSEDSCGADHAHHGAALQASCGERWPRARCCPVTSRAHGRGDAWRRRLGAARVFQWTSDATKVFRHDDMIWHRIAGAQKTGRFMRLRSHAQHGQPFALVSTVAEFGLFNRVASVAECGNAWRMVCGVGR